MGTTLLQASLLFGVSVTLGTLVYTMHRALIYPLVLRWVLVVLCIFRWYPLHWSLFKPLGCPMVREARKTLWLARRDDNPYNEPLTAWSDQVHFLYASGLVLALLVWFLPSAPLDRRHCYVAWSATALPAIAVINDLRLSWVASDVRPTVLQFSTRDLSHRCALRLIYGFFLVLGLGTFLAFAFWTIRTQC